MSWPALRDARAFDPARRVPFSLRGRPAGFVGREHLEALRAWPQWLRVGDGGVELVAPEPDAALASINAALRAQGRIRGWRDEPFTVFCLDSGEPLARFERAAARFWGTLTLAAHANGYVADALGGVAAIWIAQRAFDKATDPGAFDSLVGGGVPAGQTPHEALLREGWEEAGQPNERMRTATPGRVLRIRRDIPEGLQLEDLHVWDLELPAGTTPVNQDGEVQAFRLLPVAGALALASGSTMTVDASLVTLDLALRRGLIAPPPGAEALFDTP